MSASSIDTSPSVNHLLTLREVSALGYGTIRSLQRFVASGELPAVIVGAKTKVDPSDLRLLVKPVRAVPVLSPEVSEWVDGLVATAPPMPAHAIPAATLAFRAALRKAGASNVS